MSRGESDRTVAVIPGAGSGSRMGGTTPKQFLTLCGTPMMAVTLQPFEDCSAVDAVVLVVPERDVGFCRREIVEAHGFRKVRQVIPGGARRQDSVRKGLEAVGDACEWVVIHDAARPLVTVELLERAVRGASTYGSVITGLPVRDTVKAVNPSEQVIAAYDRDILRLIQTPQVFPCRDLIRAHRMAFRDKWSEATDDARLMEKAGYPVRVLPGSEENIKVTTPGDLRLAEWILEGRSRIGRR